MVWQFNTSAAPGDGVFGIRPIDGGGVFVCEINDADQDYDPGRNG
jgi:hypothetical protein